MVTASNGHVRPAELPELPSADPKHRDAPRRADSLPPRPAKVTDGDDRRASFRLRVQQWVASKALSRESLAYARPSSLADCWALHRASAEHYQAGLLRWPRYAWGRVHVALKAVLFGLDWVTESPARLLVAAAVAAACWFWC